MQFCFRKKKIQKRKENVPSVSSECKLNVIAVMFFFIDMVEKKHDRVADIFLILAPLIGCTYFTYKAIPSGDHKGTLYYFINNIYTVLYKLTRATTILFLYRDK